jgi:hypothetical protein
MNLFYLKSQEMALMINLVNKSLMFGIYILEREIHFGHKYKIKLLEL